MEGKSIKLIRKYLREIICLILGVSIMILTKYFPQQEKNDGQSEVKSDNVSSEMKEDSCNDGEFFTGFYEKQIEEFVSKIDGVSSVDVIVYIESVNDIVPAQNTSGNEESITEKDSNGGSRDTVSTTEKNEYVIVKDKDGNESVVVISSKMPKISGVAICAKGASSNVVREKIINSVRSAFGLEDSEIFVCS